MSRFDNAVESLLVDSDVTVKQLKKQWRLMASKHHPDRGGDAAKFHEMRQAYETCLKKLTELIKCPDCKGTAKRIVKEAWSFYSTTLPCDRCKGTGKTTRGELK